VGVLRMVSEKLKTLFGKVKKKKGEIKPEDIAKFAAKEAAGAIPVVGQIIKDAFDEFSSEPPEINLPTIQSTLRKEKATKGDFFKKEPEWIDFEERFIVEREEVDEIIKKLENDNIHLVLGEPASGKSVILKNIGFKLAKENKDAYIVALKKHSRDDVKRYFEDILEIKDEKAVFIVDDAHLLPMDCERLVSEFKNRNLKAKLIIGSRETREIRGEHPKEASEFEFLSKTDIHAEDVTEEMIKTFLKRKHDFSKERIKTVSENLEEYKKDLWHLSWALKAYNPEKDSIEEKEIYEKIRNSIRDINAEEVFLPLSVFYEFEIPIERDFLEEQLGIEEDKINELIELSEITETEEIGRNRMISLIHSSVADLYFRAYQAYPSLGRRIKKRILNQREEDLEYCLFYKYMTGTDSRNAVNVVDHLGVVWSNEEGLRKKLIEDDKIQKSIEEGIEKEEDIKKIGSCVLVIAIASEEVAREIVNRINIDTLLLKIGKEGDVRNIGWCVGCIVLANKEVGLKLVGSVLPKIEKEEDLEKIGVCVRDIAYESEEVGLKLVDSVASKIEEGEDIGKIRLCMWLITGASKKVAREIVNRLNPELREELQKGGRLK
jgi:hypothetical protein